MTEKTPRRHRMTGFLNRWQNVSYSYFLDEEDDDDDDLDVERCEMAKAGFFANTRARLNRESHFETPRQRPFHLPSNTSVVTKSSLHGERSNRTRRDFGQLFKNLNLSHQEDPDLSILSRGYIPAALVPQQTQNENTKQEEPSDTNDFSTTETESSEDDSSLESAKRKSQLLSKPRVVRFADESGLPLIQTTLYDDDGGDRTRRLIILLLCPRKRKFEFIHASYKILERITLSDVIQQLPRLATDEVLARQQYTGLCRVRHGYQELINKVAVQNCGLGQDELLIAIVAGFKGKDLVHIASPIFQNHYIVREVKRAKRSGRAVKLVQSQESLAQAETKELTATGDIERTTSTFAKKLEERHPRLVEQSPDISLEINELSSPGEDSPSSQSEVLDSCEMDHYDGCPPRSELEPFSHPPFARLVNTGVAFTFLTIFMLASRKESKNDESEYVFM